MTDEELARRLTEALDARIDRAASAPVSREILNRLPDPDTVGAAVVEAIPVRRARWKAALAAVMAVCMLGGVGLLISKLSGRTDPTQNPIPALTGSTDESRTTEPAVEVPPPEVIYDETTRTLRVTGTGGYEGIDLSRLPDALNMVVVDDDFTFTILPTILWDDTCAIKDDPVGYLPGYLDRVDRSLAAIRQFVADNAPNEEVAARTRKPVKLSLQTFKFESYRNGAEEISLMLGSGYRWHGVLYTLGLMDPETVEWKHFAYAYWVGFCVDPYNSVYTLAQEAPDPDYYYFADYYRVGGTGDWFDLKQQVLMLDACSWYDLVYGTDWDGTAAERGRISDERWFTGTDKYKDGNSMPLCMVESLLNYLAGRCGTDKVTAFCFDTCTFEEAFGMSFGEARAAWKQSLMDRFGDGGEPETDLTVPQPENCHTETFPNGATVWVKDRTYTKEYNVQTVILPSETAPGMEWYEVRLPEGFLRQEILDYEAYAAYCAEFGLEQVYTDETANYLTVSYAAAHAAAAEAAPVDMVVRGDRVWLWLWDSVSGSMNDTAGYVLTIPVPAEATILEEPIPVFTDLEKELQTLYHSTAVTEQADGKLRIEGWTAGIVKRYLLLYSGDRKIALRWEDSQLLSEQALYEKLAYPGVKILAEDCELIPSTDEEGLEYDFLYQVGRLTVLDTEPAEPFTFAKPVIYLYPEAETRVEVKLDLEGRLSCAYPAYDGGWTVTAAPDGTLTDAAGQTYSYLYWEGESGGAFDFSRGFCVAGRDTAAFLEEALAELGLNRREANEFIVYWLPLMQDNAWNLISFQGAAYTDRARLEVSPAPDTLIRVFMAWRALEAPVEIEPQELTAPERKGFTVVEWGGGIAP